MTTNVPFPTFGPQGFSAPARSDVFTGIMADINAAFGGDLNLDPSEPQGQLGVSFTECVGFFQDLFLAYTQLVDPAYSSGRMQDAIGRLYFQERIPAQSTTTVATCVGAAGTIIPANALAKTADGQIYYAVAAGTIGAGGSVDIEFASLASGPVPCPAGFLSVIYQATPGWDTITNAADGVLGRDVESSTAFEARRQASVASNARTTQDSIRGALLGVPGVLDAYVIDNPTAAAHTTGGVSLAAHSLFVSVFGGADLDVARAIWSKKAPGCGYTGTTTVTIEDTNGGYSIPYPTYAVTFTRAALLPVTIAVQLANNAQVPSTVLPQVQAAVQSVFTGSDAGGQGRPRIGSRLFANRFYAAIAALGPWAQIVDIQLSVGGGTPAAFIDVNIDQIPSVNAGAITVALV